MDLLKHDITTEFPEYREKIHTMKTSHQHFARLFREFDQANHEIAKVETGGAVMTDEALEDLKKRRLRLKDEMAHMLRTI